MSSMIRCIDVAKSYPGPPPVTALQQASFEVGRGELFGCIGPDGAGKTSLFRMLATLSLPDKGRIEVDGLDTVADFKAIRNKVGYMPGRFSLYLDLSVQENLDFFAKVFQVRIADNYDLIRDIYEQLAPFVRRRAGKLSGGMKQKLALCCALIHRPELLILDEPTTGVDPVSRKEFWDMLQKLCSQGMTVVVSTPYMDEAGLCGRIALMQSGQILGIDSPQNIVAGYGRPLYALSASDNYRLLLALRSHASVSAAYIFGDRLHVNLMPELPASATDVLLKDLEAQGLEGLRLRNVSPSVEDCFIQMTHSQA
jgi:ABC-type multidrug transport system, ATPase component